MKIKFTFFKKFILISSLISLTVYFSLKHEIKPIVLPNANPHVICNIDSVSGYALKNDTFNPLGHISTIIFNGWIAVPNLNLAPNKVEILLLSPSNGKFIFLTDSTRILRHDVSISFNKDYLLDNAGFAISSKYSKNIENSLYNIYILGYFDGFTSMCSINQNIIF